MAMRCTWNNDGRAHHLLDVLERVNREIPLRDLRWSVAHLHDASDETLTRMKTLGVGWLMQNGLYFAAASFLAHAARRSPRAGDQDCNAARPQYRGGTDANRVMSYNPFVSLKWMTDGRTVDGPGDARCGGLVFARRGAASLHKGSAWFTFDDDKRGTLEPGRLADLAVLDRDYLTGFRRRRSAR